MLRSTTLAGLILAAATSLSAQAIINTSATMGAADSRPRRASASAAAAVNTSAVERRIFERLNEKRAERGLAPLVWDDQVAAIAREHSVDMATMRYFAHKDLDGKYVSDRADSHGLKKWQAIGENIAFNRGYADPVERTVQLWMESDSHRKNLLDDHWRESAVGVAVAADGSFFFTQVFIKKK